MYEPTIKISQFFHSSYVLFRSLRGAVTMRMRLQALKSCTDTPLHVTKHLELSDKGIVAIEGLHHCPLLESLVLRCNYVDMLCNLDCCRNLWQLDLTGNRVRSLIGIGQFPALGGLYLSYNELNWRELLHLHHIHILRLTLIGNPQLDSDPNYRHHVVSMLPHVWMLDGLLITAGERSKVVKFFHDSKNSTRPVWCRSSHDNFTPSIMKNLFVRGKFGPKTAHMMQHFPIHCVHTAELDWRRLGYLGNSMEEQMQLETKTEFPLLRLILDNRRGDEEVDQCNMLLLLLLAALKYKLPAITMAAAYSTAKLQQLCSGVQHIEKLPSRVQLQLASLLLSAVVIDHDTKANGVLSCLLLNSILSTFQTVHREMQTDHSSSWRNDSQRKEDKFSESVLAAEVVQIFCLVPTFIDTLIDQSHPGVIRLVAMATRNSEVMEIITTIATSSPRDKQQQNVASYLMDILQHNVLLQKHKQVAKPKQRRHSTPNMGGLNNTTMYTTTRVKSAGNIARCKSIGDVKDSVTIATGDTVLLGDQGMVATVISEQENHSILVRTVSELKNRYFNVNVKNVKWNHDNGCWETDIRWLDSSVDMATHSTLSVISNEAFTSEVSINPGCHGDNSTEDEVARGNQKLSLVVDMSDKSVHDIMETMATDTMITTDRAKSPDVPSSPLQTVWEHDSSVSSKVDLSSDYRILQRQQLKNNDVNLVEPYPPPTSPTNSSYTPVIIRNAWGRLSHQSTMTKHTLTSYNRLLHCRKQQQRPIRSTRSSGAIILQQSQSQPLAHYTDRMPVHQATKSLLSIKSYQWRSPPTTTVPPSTRKLGNILTIDGSSVLN